MIKTNLTKIFFFLSLLIFLFGSGYRLGQYQEQLKFSKRLNLIDSSQTFFNKEVTSDKKNHDISLFWDVWDKLEKKYIDKKRIDNQKMIFGAIKGMVASLNDPYTFFLTPDENKKSKNDLSGKFEGIGAQLGLKNNRIVVIAPLKNSPAEKAGLKAGDFINKVNDESTADITLTEAVNKIRGPKGTKVKLTIERNNRRKDVEIIRDEINVPSIELSFEKNNIAYIKVNQFGDKTYDEWDKAVDQILARNKKETIKGIIVDVRDNPGGYLEGAIYLASEFLSFGQTIVKQESTTYKNKTYYSQKNGRLQNFPLVVLINQGSASASEIFAGALRDNKKGVLVGQKSFGKGSVQEAIDLAQGAGLHVTVAKWILPNGDWINEKGIEPTIKIDNQIKEGNTLTRQDDRQLDKALEILLK